MRFRFRLALALGKTVGELSATIGCGELAEWIAFYKIEPFGGPVEDIRAGIMPALTVNMNRAPDATQKRVSPLDFFPWADKPQPEQEAPKPESADELAKQIRRRIFRTAD